MFLCAPLNLRAQSHIKLSGLAYLDYFYNLDHRDETREGVNGFTYRRLYLTTDFVLAEDFTGRARLESGESSTNNRGTVPFIKDLYLTYLAPGGHTLTGGIAPNPVYQVSEDFIGYRVLEQTVIEYFRRTSSRDFGLLLKGPIVPGLRYSAMLANGNSIRPEDDKYKRVYGQVEAYPFEGSAFSFGADYAAAPEGEGTLTLNGFAGIDTGILRFGVEGFLARSEGPGPEGPGISVTAIGKLNSRLELYGRADFVDETVSPVDDPRTNLFLVGLTFQPNERVRLIPNLHWVRFGDESDPSVMARMTAELKF